MDTRWKPSVTVAAIVERDGRFLLVEEETADGSKLNKCIEDYLAGIRHPLSAIYTDPSVTGLILSSACSH
jgi:hypothetical protein